MRRNSVQLSILIGACLLWLPGPLAADDQALGSARIDPPPPPARTLRSWEEALALVRAHAPAFLDAQADVTRAQARSRAALAAIFPSLDAQVAFNRQFFTREEQIDGARTALPLQDVWIVGGAVSWTVVDPRAYYGLGTAQRDLAATHAQLAAQRRSIALTLVSAMLATLAVQRAAELNRVGLQAAFDRLQLAEQRVQYGNGTALDLDRARQDVAAARAPVITGDEALRQAREALGLVLGSAVETAAPGDLSLTQFEHAVASSCKAHAEIEQRPDLVAARLRSEVAERGIDDAWLRFAPTLSLQSQLAWGSPVQNGPNTTWNLRAVLSIPLWDGGLRYAQLLDARAIARQAHNALTQARLNALTEAAQASRGVDVTRATLEVAEQQRELANSVDQRTREGYQHGLGTSLDLVTSGAALRQAELNLILSRFRSAQARVVALLSHADCVF